VNVKPTALPEVLIVELERFTDDRGFFLERYHEEKFARLGLPGTWRQDNHSRSRRGVLRGLHYQLRRPQGKLVWCARGSAFDVAVDIRAGSPTFGQWASITLTEDLPQLLWIPPGFAHGFCALSDMTDIIYKCTEVYVPSDERGLAWNDPELGIRWPVTPPILSPRDRDFPQLRDAMTELPAYAAPVTTAGR
jgi:dTDP-4-dehydrorhamnose 3,5-epimerase